MRVFFQDGPTARTQLKVHAKSTKGDGQQEKKIIIFIMFLFSTFTCELSALAESTEAKMP